METEQIIYLSVKEQPQQGDLVEVKGEFDSLYGVWDATYNRLDGWVHPEHGFKRIIERPAGGKKVFYLKEGK